ncbi:MAG: protein phosphatase 2C domain-containing protein [Chloroflexaceae bacterium]|nr:protein phosphatase 2C domain-containing protein [Chloroflexaceae bacterium]
MEAQRNEVRWYGVGASVVGASHRRANQPNQDAIRWSPREAGPAETLVLALSDGHGGAKYFRSHTGALFAVDVAITILNDLQRTGSNESPEIDLSRVKRLAEEQIPRMLVREWSERVTTHYKGCPLTRQETTPLLEREGPAAEEAVRNAPILTYGATIIAVAITPSFILYLQLGDGDILTVSEAGEVSRPIPPDERLFANETTSLCTRHAWREVRFSVQPVQATPEEHLPALILVATDGYSNSFQDEAAFRQVGADVLALVRAEGIETVRSSLEGWLNEASQQGSGDDITVGIIYRGVGVSPPASAAPTLVGTEAGGEDRDEPGTPEQEPQTNQSGGEPV